jgi:accessory gene regulator protein AgrB
MSSSYFSYLRIFLLLGFIGCYIMTILSLTLITELWNYNEFFFIAGSVFLVLFLLTHVMQYIPVTENEKIINEESYGNKKRGKKKEKRRE